jgi:Protein of unknown function with HXXEE motif
MTGDRTLRLIPVLFAVHSMEEALTFATYLPIIRARLPEWGWTAVSQADPHRFLLSLLVLTTLPFVIAFSGSTVPGSARGYMLLALQATLLLNVASHVATATLIRGYAPGVITAVVINLPFSIYVLQRATRERWYRASALWLLVPLAVLLHGPLLAGFLFLFGAFSR